MLPPLFGLSWGMYVVVGAIIALLILLLVMMSQRRKKAALSAHLGAQPSSKAKAPKHMTKAEKAAMYAELRQAAAAAEASQAAAAPAPALPGSYAAGALAPAGLPQTPLPPAGYIPAPMPGGLPPAPAPSAHAVPIEDLLPGADPLQAIIVDLLSGWGDLTQEDTNRLSVFRPERVLAAVASADIPREIKANEYARARLAQLRRWASGLEQTLRNKPSVPTPQPEYAGIGALPATEPPQPMAAPAPVTPTPPAFAPIPPQPRPASAPSWLSAPQGGAPLAPAIPAAVAPAVAPLVAPIVAVAAPAVPFFQQPPAEAAPAYPEPLPVAAPVVAPTPLVAQPVATPVVTAPALDTDDVNRSAEAAIAAAAAAFWARSELGSTTGEAAPPVAPTPPLAPPIPQATPVTEAAPYQPAPQAPVFPPLGQELPGLAVATPHIEAPRVPVTPPASWPAPAAAGASDTFLQDLAGGVTTAEALLALPAAEQPGLLAFLKPSELGKVLQTSGDAQLKKAVIETLESVGSPTALDIIYRSLDDADPEVQAKALEAADRILGA